MKIYISGGITGKYDYKKQFDETEIKLKNMRHTVLNPTSVPLGLEYDDYMHIAYAMIDVADSIYMLKGWTKSKGANLEHEYALKQGKMMLYE